MTDSILFPAAIKSNKPFFLFGMGNRRKFIYNQGQLTDLFSGKVLFNCQFSHEAFQPEEYRVQVITKAAGIVSLIADR
jgi:hypothetical protein